MFNLDLSSVTGSLSSFSQTSCIFMNTDLGAREDQGIDFYKNHSDSRQVIRLLDFRQDCNLMTSVAEAQVVSFMSLIIMLPMSCLFTQAFHHIFFFL